jgi:hypothetical protein
MGSRDGAARVRSWRQWQEGTGGSRPPPGWRRLGGKDFLGAAATLAIIGAILLFLTNGLAAHCAAVADPRTGARVCTGAAAVAAHIRGIMTLCVLGCGALAVAAFIWYVCWGYKANQPMESGRGGAGDGYGQGAP